MKKVSIIDIYTVDVESNAFSCLAKFEINNARTILVVKNGKVLGTVTDGDIRKVLVNQRLLTIPVRTVMNNHFHYGLNEGDCEKIFKKYPHISLVPLVNSHMDLLDIYILG